MVIIFVSQFAYLIDETGDILKYIQTHFNGKSQFSKLFFDKHNF